MTRVYRRCCVALVTERNSSRRMRQLSKQRKIELTLTARKHVSSSSSTSNEKAGSSSSSSNEKDDYTAEDNEEEETDAKKSKLSSIPSTLVTNEEPSRIAQSSVDFEDTNTRSTDGLSKLRGGASTTNANSVVKTKTTLGGDDEDNDVDYHASKDDDNNDDADADEQLLGSPTKLSKPSEPSSDKKDDFYNEEEDENEDDNTRNPQQQAMEEKPGSSVLTKFRSKRPQLSHPIFFNDTTEFTHTLETLINSVETTRRLTRRKFLSQVLQMLDKQIVEDAMGVAEERSGCLGRPYSNNSDPAEFIQVWPKGTITQFLKIISGCGDGFSHPQYLSLDKPSDCDKAKQTDQLDVWDLSTLEGTSDVRLSVTGLRIGNCNQPHSIVAEAPTNEEVKRTTTILGFVISGANQLVAIWDKSTPSGDDHDLLKPVVEKVLLSLWNAIVNASPYMQVLFPRGSQILTCELKVSVLEREVRLRSVKSISKLDGMKQRLLLEISKQLQRKPINDGGKKMAVPTVWTCSEIEKSSECTLERIAMAPDCTAMFPHPCPSSSAALMDLLPARVSQRGTTSPTKPKASTTTTAVKETDEESNNIDPYGEEIAAEGDSNGDGETTPSKELEVPQSKEIEGILRISSSVGGCIPLQANETLLPMMEPSAELFM